MKSVVEILHYENNLLVITYPKMFLGFYKRACTLLFHVVAIHFTVSGIDIYTPKTAQL